MQDFSSFVQSGETGKAGRETGAPQDAEAFVGAVQDMARAFGGKNEGELLRAIYAEAERSRRAGTLSDAEIDNFAAAVAPMLDASKRKKLAQVVARLKKM